MHDEFIPMHFMSKVMINMKLDVVTDTIYFHKHGCDNAIKGEAV